LVVSSKFSAYFLV
ncbi:putative membrane protein, partial [Vibrio parahaemolyticus V-223/04]